jgi:hypothetical protein
MKGMVNLVKGAATSKKSDRISKQTRTSPADVISWSGCKDSQTSADTVEAGQSTGAMSFVSLLPPLYSLGVGNRRYHCVGLAAERLGYI